MYNYPITVNIVSTAVCTGLLCLYNTCIFMSQSRRSPRGERAKACSRSWAPWIVSSVMLVLAVNYVPISSTLSCSSRRIPISMVISALAFVGVRYDRFQILGAAVVS